MFREVPAVYTQICVKDLVIPLSLDSSSVGGRGRGASFRAPVTEASSSPSQSVPMSDHVVVALRRVTAQHGAAKKDSGSGSGSGSALVAVSNPMRLPKRFFKQLRDDGISQQNDNANFGNSNAAADEGIVDISIALAEPLVHVEVRDGLSSPSSSSFSSSTAVELVVYQLPVPDCIFMREAQFLSENQMQNAQIRDEAETILRSSAVATGGAVAAASPHLQHPRDAAIGGVSAQQLLLADASAVAVAPHSSAAVDTAAEEVGEEEDNGSSSSLSSWPPQLLTVSGTAVPSTTPEALALLHLLEAAASSSSSSSSPIRVLGRCVVVDFDNTAMFLNNSTTSSIVSLSPLPLSLKARVELAHFSNRLALSDVVVQGSAPTRSDAEMQQQKQQISKASRHQRNASSSNYSSASPPAADLAVVSVAIEAHGSGADLITAMAARAQLQQHKQAAAEGAAAGAAASASSLMGSPHFEQHLPKVLMCDGNGGQWASTTFDCPNAVLIAQAAASAVGGSAAGGGGGLVNPLSGAAAIAEALLDPLSRDLRDSAAAINALLQVTPPTDFLREGSGALSSPSSSSALGYVRSKVATPFMPMVVQYGGGGGSSDSSVVQYDHDRQLRRSDDARKQRLRKQLFQSRAYSLAVMEPVAPQHIETPAAAAAGNGGGGDNGVPIHNVSGDKAQNVAASTAAVSGGSTVSPPLMDIPRLPIAVTKFTTRDIHRWVSRSDAVGASTGGLLNQLGLAGLTASSSSSASSTDSTRANFYDARVGGTVKVEEVSCEIEGPSKGMTVLRISIDMSRTTNAEEMTTRLQACENEEAAELEAMDRAMHAIRTHAHHHNYHHQQQQQQQYLSSSNYTNTNYSPHAGYLSGLNDDDFIAGQSSLGQAPVPPSPINTPPPPPPTPSLRTIAARRSVRNAAVLHNETAYRVVLVVHKMPHWLSMMNGEEIETETDGDDDDDNAITKSSSSSPSQWALVLQGARGRAKHAKRRQMVLAAKGNAPFATRGEWTASKWLLRAQRWREAFIGVKRAAPVAIGCGLGGFGGLDEADWTSDEDESDNDDDETASASSATPTLLFKPLSASPAVLKAHMEAMLKHAINASNSNSNGGDGDGDMLHDGEAHAARDMHTSPVRSPTATARAAAAAADRSAVSFIDGDVSAVVHSPHSHTNANNHQHHPYAPNASAVFPHPYHPHQLVGDASLGAMNASAAAARSPLHDHRHSRHNAPHDRWPDALSPAMDHRTGYSLNGYANHKPPQAHEQHLSTFSHGNYIPTDALNATALAQSGVLHHHDQHHNHQHNQNDSTTLFSHRGGGGGDGSAIPSAFDPYQLGSTGVNAAAVGGRGDGALATRRAAAGNGVTTGNNNNSVFNNSSTIMLPNGSTVTANNSTNANAAASFAASLSSPPERRALYPPADLSMDRREDQLARGGLGPMSSVTHRSYEVGTSILHSRNNAMNGAANNTKSSIRQGGVLPMPMPTSMGGASSSSAAAAFLNIPNPTASSVSIAERTLASMEARLAGNHIEGSRSNDYLNLRARPAAAGGMASYHANVDGHVQRDMDAMPSATHNVLDEERSLLTSPSGRHLHQQQLPLGTSIHSSTALLSGMLSSSAAGGMTSLQQSTTAVAAAASVLLGHHAEDPAEARRNAAVLSGYGVAAAPRGGGAGGGGLADLSVAIPPPHPSNSALLHGSFAGGAQPHVLTPPYDRHYQQQQQQGYGNTATSVSAASSQHHLLGPLVSTSHHLRSIVPPHFHNAGGGGMVTSPSLLLSSGSGAAGMSPMVMISSVGEEERRARQHLHGKQKDHLIRRLLSAEETPNPLVAFPPPAVNGGGGGGAVLLANDRNPSLQRIEGRLAKLGGGGYRRHGGGVQQPSSSSVHRPLPLSQVMSLAPSDVLFMTALHYPSTMAGVAPLYYTAIYAGVVGGGGEGRGAEDGAAEVAEHGGVDSASSAGTSHHYHYQQQQQQLLGTSSYYGRPSMTGMGMGMPLVPSTIATSHRPIAANSARTDTLVAAVEAAVRHQNEAKSRRSEAYNAFKRIFNINSSSSGTARAGFGADHAAARRASKKNWRSQMRMARLKQQQQRTADSNGDKDSKGSTAASRALLTTAQPHDDDHSNLLAHLFACPELEGLLESLLGDPAGIGYAAERAFAAYNDHTRARRGGGGNRSCRTEHNKAGAQSVVSSNGRRVRRWAAVLGNALASTVTADDADVHGSNSNTNGLNSSAAVVALHNKMRRYQWSAEDIAARWVLIAALNMALLFPSAVALLCVTAVTARGFYSGMKLFLFGAPPRSAKKKNDGGANSKANSTNKNRNRKRLGMFEALSSLFTTTTRSSSRRHAAAKKGITTGADSSMRKPNKKMTQKKNGWGSLIRVPRLPSFAALSSPTASPLPRPIATVLRSLSILSNFSGAPSTASSSSLGAHRTRKDEVGHDAEEEEERLGGDGGRLRGGYPTTSSSSSSSDDDDESFINIDDEDFVDITLDGSGHSTALANKKIHCLTALPLESMLLGAVANSDPRFHRHYLARLLAMRGGGGGGVGGRGYLSSYSSAAAAAAASFGPPPHYYGGALNSSGYSNSYSGPSSSALLHDPFNPYLVAPHQHMNMTAAAASSAGQNPYLSSSYIGPMPDPFDHYPKRQYISNGSLVGGVGIGGGGGGVNNSTMAMLAGVAPASVAAAADALSSSVAFNGGLTASNQMAVAAAAAAPLSYPYPYPYPHYGNGNGIVGMMGAVGPRPLPIKAPPPQLALPNRPAPYQGLAPTAMHAGLFDLARCCDSYRLHKELGLLRPTAGGGGGGGNGAMKRSNTTGANGSASSSSSSPQQQTKVSLDVLVKLMTVSIVKGQQQDHRLALGMGASSSSSASDLRNGSHFMTGPLSSSASSASSASAASLSTRFRRFIVEGQCLPLWLMLLAALFTVNLAVYVFLWRLGSSGGGEGWGGLWSSAPFSAEAGASAGSYGGRGPFLFVSPTITPTMFVAMAMTAILVPRSPTVLFMRLFIRLFLTAEELN